MAGKRSLKFHLFRNRDGQTRPAKTEAKIFSHVSASVLIVIFVAALAQFELDGLKGILVDGLFRLRWHDKPHPDIALIAYDDISSRDYAGSLKIPAEEIAGIFHHLKEEHPRAVGVLGSINMRDYSDEELKTLATAMSSVPNAMVGFLSDESLGNPPPAYLVSAVKYLPGFISRDTFSYGADSVTRRVMISIEGFPTIFDELARQYRGLKRGEGFAAVESQGRSGNTLQTYIDWQVRPGAYPKYSSHQIAEGRFPRGVFQNKVVILGSALSHKESDFILTPFSREPFTTPFLEGAAESLATLMRNEGIEKSSPFVNTLLCLILGLATVNFVLFLSPGRGIIFMISMTGALLVSAFAMLRLRHYWIDLAHPLVTACVSYYVVVPYRLFNEYRVRWHYQEKSELMGQLEQLKNNFLSLITHDLKTPIARIQGSAELLLNEAHQLTDAQRKSLSGIVHTTENLSEYVESILDLARIESAEVPIQKSSKDINATILEVIETKRFLAQDKNIELEVQLEPIFSFKFDVKLIHRVLSNLVENAIKYSPPDTRIVIASKEDGDWIRVSVRDEGFGIPFEEQGKVWEKFYRIPGEHSSKTKGTGLGLYLVKYFVELHRGIVELKSELGKGSVFTVSLPM
jgi:signal transduction histidine kinase